MNRVSACVITLNEEENLSRALASLVGIADEIVVVNSGSIDRTEEIARQHGAQFHPRLDQLRRPEEFRRRVRHQRLDPLARRRRGTQQPAAHFAVELEESLPTSEAVYEMAHHTFYLGAWIAHSGWYPDFQRRLYRRDAAEFSGLVHESLKFEGKPGRLPGDILHYTVRSFAEHEANVERYTTLAARQMFAQGQRSWRGALWFATPWSWFQNFVLRGGFLDGHRGALIAQMAARSVRLKYAKLGRLVASAGQTGSRP